MRLPYAFRLQCQKITSKTTKNSKIISITEANRTAFALYSRRKSLEIEFMVIRDFLVCICSNLELDLDVMIRSQLDFLKLPKYSDPTPNVTPSTLSAIELVEPDIPISSGISWLNAMANLVST
jgi:hypothetical protein